MTITAREEKRHLVIDLGDGETTITIPPIKGADGRRATALLVGVAFGAVGPEASADEKLTAAEANTDELTRMVLGEGLPGWEERYELFESLRGTEQMLVGQAAMFWNVQGGSIEAVNDILDSEAGVGLPKALNRVMASYGVGEQFKRLTSFLGGS